MSEHEAAVKRDPRVDPRAGDIVRTPDLRMYVVTKVGTDWVSIVSILPGKRAGADAFRASIEQYRRTAGEATVIHAEVEG